MADWIRFNSFMQDLVNGVHDFSSDQIKIALTNVAPVVSNTVLADITEIADTGGYVAGGLNVANGAVSLTGATAVFDFDDLEIAASGADIDTFQYVVAYNDDTTGDRLICFSDVGSTDIVDGSSRTIVLPTSGLFDLGTAA
jgi:hypothetical protein